MILCSPKIHSSLFILKFLFHFNHQGSKTHFFQCFLFPATVVIQFFSLTTIKRSSQYIITLYRIYNIYKIMNGQHYKSQHISLFTFGLALRFIFPRAVLCSCIVFAQLQKTVFLFSFALIPSFRFIAKAITNQYSYFFLSSGS